MAIIDMSIMDALTETLGVLRPKAAYADYDLLEGERAILVIDRAVEPGIAGLDLDWTEEPLDEPSDEALADRFAVGLSEGRGLNLLQGKYRSKAGINVPRLPAIRFAALAAAAVLMVFVWNGVNDRVAAAQAEDLRAETAADYLAATGQRAPANPGRAAAKSIQSGAVSRTGFLDLSSVLFAGLSTLDDIRVDQMKFNSEKGTLQLRLIYPSFDAAARAESSVAQAGGLLTTGGVREQNGSFVGEATLSMGSGS